ncbi:hypothetical protein ACIBO6_04810 [Streptomyces luteogriseus]|uniref:hypothetical protein n=1 Tax=Streptomyces luteogriseus TaxID=68233 RepID=UPI0037ABCA3A
MSELLTSTPRPAWHRAATLAGTTAITLASAFALLVLVGGVQVLANTEYTHLGWLPVSLVGALFLVAGAVLGMGMVASVLNRPVGTADSRAFPTLDRGRSGMGGSPWFSVSHCGSTSVLVNSAPSSAARKPNSAGMESSVDWG